MTAGTNGPGNRPHLASLLLDLERRGDEPAVVSKYGLRTVRTPIGSLHGSPTFSRTRIARHRKRRPCRDLGANGSEWIAAFRVHLGVIPVPLMPRARRNCTQSHPGRKPEACDLAEQIHALDRGCRRSPSRLMKRCLPSLYWSLSRVFRRTTPTDCLHLGTTGEPTGGHTHRNVLVSLGPIEREIQKYLGMSASFIRLDF